MRNWNGAFGCASSLEDAQEENYRLLFDVFDTLIREKQTIPTVAKAEERDFIIKAPLDTSIRYIFKNFVD